MKHKLMGVVSGVLATVMIMTASTVSAVDIKTYSEDLSVYYNNNDVYENSVNKPIIINDRTMVQIKPIFELMGFSADYNDLEKKATFTSADQSLKYVFISEDFNIYKIVGDSEKQSVKVLDVPATIYNDTFYVPLRGFCDVFGMNIDWVNSERKVLVSGNSDTKVDPLSFTDFIGEWGNISALYLAQSVDINMDILNVDEIHKTITLKYKYDMDGSGIWSGGSVEYSNPITISYTTQNVKIKVGDNGYSSEYKEYNSLITEPIMIMGSNKDVSSIIGEKDETLCKIRLIVPGDGNMYFTPTATAENISCTKSDICEKIN